MGSDFFLVHLGRGDLIGDYKGLFKFNHRHGYGELTYPDGTVFKGEWKYDEKVICFVAFAICSKNRKRFVSAYIKRCYLTERSWYRS